MTKVVQHRFYFMNNTLRGSDMAITTGIKEQLMLKRILHQLGITYIFERVY